MWITLFLFLVLLVGVSLSYYVNAWVLSASLLLLLFWKPSPCPTYIRQWCLIRYLTTVLNLTIIWDVKKPEQSRQCIFSFHPHGYLAFSQMATFVFGKEGTVLYPYTENSISLVSSALLLIPIIGHYARMLGCEPVSRDNIEKHLSEKKKNLSIAPGGTREIIYVAKSDNEVIIIKRTGILKLAFKHGTLVIPCLTKGDNTCHSYLFHGNRLQRFMQNLISYPWPVLAFGKYFTFWPNKGHHLDLFVGNYTDPTLYDTEERFIAAYFTELKRLAESNNIKLTINET